MRGLVVLVGRPTAGMARIDARIERWQPRELTSRRLSDVRVVVLFPDALRQLDPAETRAALGSAVAKVLVVVGVSDAAAGVILGRWAAAGFLLVEAARVSDVVAIRLAVPVRAVVAPDRWLGVVPPRDSDAFRAVSVVDALPTLDVATWAAVLGWHPRRLLRVCRAAFGTTAKKVLMRHVRAAAVDLHDRHGVSYATCAERLDYADDRSLRRARRGSE